MSMVKIIMAVSLSVLASVSLYGMRDPDIFIDQWV